MHVSALAGGVDIPQRLLSAAPPAGVAVSKCTCDPVTVCTEPSLPVQCCCWLVLAAAKWSQSGYS